MFLKYRNYTLKRLENELLKGIKHTTQIKLFKSKLVSRYTKLTLYWSVIRPIVVYGCETYVLKENIIQRLSVFERNILRRIFEQTKEDNGIWRTEMNKELDELTNTGT
jgi:hypothetical protein